MTSAQQSRVLITMRTPARLEAADVHRLRPEFERIALTRGDVAVDFSRTIGIDGSGVGALVFVFKRLAANGHRLSVRNVTGQPRDLLGAAGLLRVLDCGPANGIVRGLVHRFGLTASRPAVAPPDEAAPAPDFADHRPVHAGRTKGAA